MAQSLCAWGDIPPGASFTRLPVDQLVEGGVAWNGVPENRHTGGLTGSLWHPNDNPQEVWKPLDCGAHPLEIAKGDLRRWSTDEWHVIDLLRRAGRMGAQMHARRETGEGGRQWLVMPRYLPGVRTTRWEVLHELEQTVWWLNGRGWSANDHFTVMTDPLNRQPVFVDFSDASFHRPTSGIYAADDREAWLAWLEHIGGFRVTQLRRAAKEKLLITWTLEPERARRQRGDARANHVYVSTMRPFSFAWADWRDGDQDLLRTAWIEPDQAPWHTWVGTVQPLSTEYQRRHELAWAWSHITYDLDPDGR